MPLIKTVALVIVAGAAGALLAEQADKHLSKPLGLDKPEKAGTRAAVRTGYTAGGAALVYVVLASVI